MTRHTTHHRPIEALLSVAIALPTLIFTVGTASAVDPLGCQAAKFSAHVHHARCVVRCQSRASDRVDACEQKCDNRRDRRLAVLQRSAVCTGASPSTDPNNSACDLQLLNAGWKQVKCFLRCQRLGISRETFDTTGCNNKCTTRFNAAKERILRQPICSRHDGRMPTIN